MSNFVDVSVETRSGKPVISNLRLKKGATVDDLQNAIYDDMDRKGRYHPTRQRLTLPPAAGAKTGKALERGKSLEFYGIASHSVIQYKDLGLQGIGSQVTTHLFTINPLMNSSISLIFFGRKWFGQKISYKLVFFLEYLGPMLVYPFFWSDTGRELLHGVNRSVLPTTLTQNAALAYWTFHYFKRIYETSHVHVFSHGTMPIFNLFRNCSYYWLFAAFVSYNINHPMYTEPPHTVMITAFVIAYCCQIGNYMSHVTLSKLRKSPTSGYSIPRGGLFNYVTCANYTYEIWGWICFTIATQSLPAAIFAACGAFQMVQWAISKHKRLRKLFDGQEGREKYPKRWIILPPLL